MEDEKLKLKISEQERQKAMDKCNEVIGWLDVNQVWLFDLDLSTEHLIQNSTSVFVSSLQVKMRFSISRGSWRKFVGPSWASSTSVLQGCPAGEGHHQALALRRSIKSRPWWVSSAFSHNHLIIKGKTPTVAFIFHCRCHKWVSAWAQFSFSSFSKVIKDCSIIVFFI